jgi:hypothetical protein
MPCLGHPGWDELLRQPPVLGILPVPRTVRAVRYALRRMCKWGELYLSSAGNVNSDEMGNRRTRIYLVRAAVCR